MEQKLQDGLTKWREAGSPTKTRDEKWAENPTRKLAMERMCIDCMGGADEQGHKASIRGCTSPQCSLYAWRPFK